MVKYLVDLGADVNIQDECGWTPLHEVVKEGNEKIVEYLVEEKGVDFNIKIDHNNLKRKREVGNISKEENVKIVTKNV